MPQRDEAAAWLEAFDGGLDLLFLVPVTVEEGGEPVTRLLPFDKTRIFPYAYRHTYAQRHADAGVAPDVLKELMDHTDLKVNSVRTRSCWPVMIAAVALPQPYVTAMTRLSESLRLQREDGGDNPAALHRGDIVAFCNRQRNILYDLAEGRCETRFFRAGLIDHVAVFAPRVALAAQCETDWMQRDSQGSVTKGA